MIPRLTQCNFMVRVQPAREKARLQRCVVCVKHDEKKETVLLQGVQCRPMFGVLL
jgi:hypothetical protein